MTSSIAIGLSRASPRPSGASEGERALSRAAVDKALTAGDDCRGRRRLPQNCACARRRRAGGIVHGVFRSFRARRGRHRRQWRHRARHGRGPGEGGRGCCRRGPQPRKIGSGGREACGLGAAGAFIPLDVADPDSCREMVRRTVERFGRLDILVNNAGMSIRKPPEDYARRGMARRARHQPDRALGVLPGGLPVHEESRAAARSSISGR